MALFGCAETATSHRNTGSGQLRKHGVHINQTKQEARAR